MKVLLVVDIVGLKDKNIFNKHLKKEGFKQIEGEDFAYEGEAHTHLYNTKTYILDVVSKALEKSDFSDCKIIFQIGENPMETYVYNRNKKDFINTND